MSGIQRTAGLRAIGVLGGLFNGFLVSLVGILPFVATRGALTMFSGMAFPASDGKTIFGREIPEGFSYIDRSGLDLPDSGLTRMSVDSFVCEILVGAIILAAVASCSNGKQGA